MYEGFMHDPLTMHRHATYSRVICPLVYPRRIECIVIDEAHCIFNAKESNFRPDYQSIGSKLTELCPQSQVCVHALDLRAMTGCWIYG